MLNCLRLRLVALMLMGWMVLAAQQDDPVLFSVADMDVPLSEFEYIYNKNNRDQADYSRKSVMEYLDLYTKFKLKVARARELQLDTIKALQDELAGYRTQLAKSYLNDKEVKEKLAREAYERMQEDVRLSHILFRVDADAGDAAWQAAREKAEQARARISNGEDFATLAKTISEDKTSAQRGGDLGFLTALFPSGFYEMESAAYGLQPGEVSAPVRSSLGYHLLKLQERRPARGQIEAAHILVRVKQDGSNEAAAKQKIEAIAQSLAQGKSFEEMARTLSDDEPSARRGGFIGKIGINMYDREFEEAAFAITEVGGYSKPVRTRIGWHIIKLLKKVRLEPFEQERRKIEARLSRDERIEIATQAMIDNIKKESGFRYDQDVLDAMTGDLGEDFLSFQWKVPQMEERVLISFDNGRTHSNLDFANYLKANTRQRMRAPRGTDPEAIALELFDAYVSDKCLEYEESRLDEKYPDFAALMREYEEGILLFEVTKMHVWDPASNDTAGLRAFHEAHRGDYLWPERAEVHAFRINSTDPKIIAKAHKLAARKPTAKVIATMNKKELLVTYETKKYTAEESFQRGLLWTPPGYISDPIVAEGEEHATFSKVVRIIPEHPKKLEEARGYIIADYQDQLERAWIESLKERYPVEINEGVLKRLIKS
ncbi:MAG: peptidylprolyl isomerase [Saprospiraceae bacterium]|nr:peptidylprolyl isomerase [Saprospiraceae bacterium]